MGKVKARPRVRPRIRRDALAAMVHDILWDLLSEGPVRHARAKAASHRSQKTKSRVQDDSDSDSFSSDDDPPDFPAALNKYWTEMGWVSMTFPELCDVFQLEEDDPALETHIWNLMSLGANRTLVEADDNERQPKLDCARFRYWFPPSCKHQIRGRLTMKEPRPPLVPDAEAFLVSPPQSPERVPKEVLPPSPDQGPTHVLPPSPGRVPTDVFCPAAVASAGTTE